APVNVTLPTPTQSPSPSPTPLPTATPTPSPTPSPTPTPQPTPLQICNGTGSLVAVVRGGGTQLFVRPDGEVIAQLTTGSALTVWGRTEDGSWLVVMAGRGMPGWVSAASVVAFHLETLPVVSGS